MLSSGFRGILRRVEWYYLTDVSGQPVCPEVVPTSFLLFVHVFLLLSTYTYYCLRILRRGYPD